MLHKRKIVDRMDLYTIDISSDLNKIGNILSAQPTETIFVISAGWQLHGIITSGDIHRKAHIAKSIEELQNRNFCKIEYNSIDGSTDEHVRKAADIIFYDMHIIKDMSVRMIPVTKDNELLYAVDHEFESAEEYNYEYNGEAKNLTSYDSDAGKVTTAPLVRVFVETYNNIEYAADNLNGIMMQKTDFPFEIYVYDDCSNDGTSDVVKEFAKKYSNIITDIQSRNLYSNDYNLRKSIIFTNIKDHNCKYVAIADGDDYWTDPYKLQIQVDFLENHDEFIMCSGGYILYDHFTGTRKTKLRSYNGLTGFKYDFYKICSLGDTAWSFTRMYRADAIPGSEITDKYPEFFDTHMAYYALRKGQGYYISRIFGVYNVHSGGIYSRLSRQKKLKWIYDRCDELYCEIQDEQTIKCYLKALNAYVNECLTSKEEREHFLKAVAEKFPELTDDVITL